MDITASIPAELLARAARWGELKRWERRELGQDLRRLGLSYREILRLIPVPKGTLSGWCKDVRLAPAHMTLLRQRRPSLASRASLGNQIHSAALERAAIVRNRARLEVSTLLEDSFWVAGLVAYWSEGAKSSGRIQFANSDPDLVRLFVAWCARYLGRSPTDMGAQLHLHDGQNESERKRFWSSVTGIPIEQFTKTFVKAEGTGHRKRVLYNGTVQIRPRRSGALLHRVLGWIDGLNEAWGPLAQLARALDS